MAKTAPEVLDVKIVRVGGFTPVVDHPFSEVFITTATGDGFKRRVHYTRLFHTIDDSKFARAEQIAQFKRRWEAGRRQWGE